MNCYRHLTSALLCMTICSGHAQGLKPLSDHGKWGYIDADSNVVVPFVYDEVMPFVNGMAVVRKDSLWGFVDAGGKEKDLRYDDVSTFGNSGFYKAARNKKWTLLDQQGNALQPVREYDFILPLHKGIAIVANQGKRGLIDSNGKVVLPACYEELECGKYVVYSKCPSKPGNTIGMCDYQGHVILPEGILMSGYMPSDGIILGKVWNKDLHSSSYAFYDIAARKSTTLPSPFGIVYHEFLNGYCLVNEAANKNYFIDKTGKACSPTYEIVGPRNEGHYVVKLNGKYGVIDSLLNQKIPCDYDEGGTQICEGLWNTMKDDEWGYLDANGQTSIPFEYEFTQPFHKGHAYIGELIDGDVRFGLIDRKGKMVVPIKWRNINYTLNDKGEMGAVWVTDDSIYYRLDLTTMQYTYQQPGFNTVEFDHRGNAIVRQGEFWGCIDFDGNLRIPMRIPTKTMIESILDRMQREGKQSLNITETYRNGIYANKKRNTWALQTLIPESMWDY